MESVRWLEAITGRPWLMSSVGRRTEHAGQITITGQHACLDKSRQVLMRLSAQLQAWVSQAAEPLNTPSVWWRCCDHVKRALATIAPPTTPPFAAKSCK